MGNYSAKRRNAERRGIEFNLTREEYNFLTSFKKCAYTGRPFDLSSNGSVNNGNILTLDRIDEYGPYEIGNVVPCTAKANKVKERYIETKTPIPETIAKGAAVTLEKIKASLAIKDKWINQYIPAKSSVDNVDYEVAVLYTKFIESNPTCTLTFAAYKRVLTRVNNTFLRKPLPPKLSDRVVGLIDKDGCWEATNIYTLDGRLEKLFNQVVKLGYDSKDFGKLEEIL